MPVPTYKWRDKRMGKKSKTFINFYFNATENVHRERDRKNGDKTATIRKNAKSRTLERFINTKASINMKRKT